MTSGSDEENRAASVSILAGGVALLVGLTLPVIVGLSLVVLWDFLLVAAAASALLALVGLIAGVVALRKPTGRRRAVGGLAFAGIAIALWPLYAAWVLYIIMTYDGSL